jgi:hypothetical protein
VRSALTRAEQERWRATMAAAMRETGLLALATVPFFPPRLEAAIRPGYLALTSPENLAGFRRWRCRCRPGSSCPPVCSSSADRTQKRCCLPPGSDYQAVYPAASHVEQASLVREDTSCIPSLASSLAGRWATSVLTVLTDVPGGDDLGKRHRPHLGAAKSEARSRNVARSERAMHLFTKFSGLNKNEADGPGKPALHPEDKAKSNPQIHHLERCLRLVAVACRDCRLSSERPRHHQRVRAVTRAG